MDAPMPLRPYGNKAWLVAAGTLVVVSALISTHLWQNTDVLGQHRSAMGGCGPETHSMYWIRRGASPTAAYRPSPESRSSRASSRDEVWSRRTQLPGSG